MTAGTIWRQLLLFAIPLILGDLFQQLYNTADSIIVGRFVSKQALAAVSSTSNVVNTVIGIFTGLSTGATVVIARYFGAKDSGQLEKSVHTTLALTVVMSLLLTTLGMLGTPFLLKTLGTPEDVLPVAKQYLLIYFAGLSGLIFYNMLSGILRAIGDSRHPTLALIVAATINIVMDLLLIVGFHMGVAGAAYATIGAQYMSAFYLLALLMRADQAYGIRLKQIAFDRPILKDIVNIGLPIGIQKSLVAFSNTLVLSHINFFGSGAMAAWGVFQKVEQIDLRITNSMSVAVTTFVSQNLGAKKEARIRDGFRTAIVLTMGILALVAALGIGFRRQIVALFNPEEDVLYYASILFCMMLPIRFLPGTIMLQAGVMRGYGDSRSPMLIMLIGYVAIRQIYLNIGWHYIQTIPFVMSSYIFSWIVTILWMSIYKHKKYDVRIPARKEVLS